MSGRILIADDDDVLSEMLVDYLATEGFEVIRARDGNEAMEMAVSEAPELVVLDIMMPKLSGIDVLKAIRKDYPVPVIMLTARGDDLDRILGLELGADDYLPKPCNPRELVARIRAILRRTESLVAGSVNTSLSVMDLELVEQVEHTASIRHLLAVVECVNRAGAGELLGRPAGVGRQREPSSSSRTPLP